MRLLGMLSGRFFISQSWRQLKINLQQVWSCFSSIFHCRTSSGRRVGHWHLPREPWCFIWGNLMSRRCAFKTSTYASAPVRPMSQQNFTHAGVPRSVTPSSTTNWIPKHVSHLFENIPKLFLNKIPFAQIPSLHYLLRWLLKTFHISSKRCLWVSSARFVEFHWTSWHFHRAQLSQVAAIIMSSSAAQQIV